MVIYLELNGTLNLNYNNWYAKWAILSEFFLTNVEATPLSCQINVFQISRVSPTKVFHKKNITCRYTKKNLGATDYGFVDIYPSGDEQALKAAVATVGPIAVGIDAFLLI